MRSTTQRSHLANLSQKFSQQLLSNPLVGKAINIALDKTGAWHQRTCPLNAPFVVYLVLLMSLERSLSIGRVLALGLRFLRQQSPDLSLKAVTGEALCHARKRLGVGPLRALFEETVAVIRPQRSFHGRRLFALDTVDLRLLDTPANVAAFGRPGVARGQAGFPQIGASILLDVCSRRICDVVLARPTESEFGLAIPLLKRLMPGDVVLQDRGIAGTWVLAEYEERRIDHITRIPKHWKPRLIRRLGPGDYLVEVRGIRPWPLRRDSPGREKPRKIKLTLRLIVFRLPGRKLVRLVTSLLDHKEFPALDIARHYHCRWDIEMAFDELKTHLATVPHGTTRTVFRSKTPQGVYQEAYGLFAAYNLVRQLMNRAAGKERTSPLQISFVQTLDLVRWALAGLSGAYEAARLTINQLLTDIARSRIDRPRRPRSYPRVVKTKTSRYDAKRPRHRQQRHCAPHDVRLTEVSSLQKRAA